MTRRAGPRFLLAAFAAAVVGAIVAGVVVIDPRGEQRMLRLDARRIEDLADIARRIDRFTRDNERLPAALDELAEPPGFTAHSDPVTGTPYEYEPIDTRRYRLCATFDAGMPETGRSSYSFGYGEIWPHDRGRYCFDRSVDSIAVPQN